MNKSPTRMYWGHSLWGVPFGAVLWSLVFIAQVYGFEHNAYRADPYNPYTAWRRPVPTVMHKTFLHRYWEYATHLERSSVAVFGSGQSPRDIEEDGRHRSYLHQGSDANVQRMKLAVAGTSNAYRAATSSLRYGTAQSSVHQVKDGTENGREPAQTTPYTWHADYKDGQLLLAGDVSSESSRNAIVAAAKAAFLRTPIIDKMVLRSEGEPYGWLSAAEIAVQQLAELTEGKASFEGTKLIVSGTAQHQEKAEKIIDALHRKLEFFYTIQHNINFKEAKIPVVTPFKSTIIFHDGNFQLDGYAPDKASIERLIATIKSENAHAGIVNGMAIAQGAADGWLTCTLAGLNSVLQLEHGTVEVVDRELLLTGLTRREEIGEELPKQLRAAANRACQETVKLRVEVPSEPNLSWRAVLKGQTLEISGEVPDSGVQENLTSLASELFPDAKPLISLRVKPSRSEKWPRVAAMALQLLAKLRNGEARIEAQALMLTGEAKDTAAQTSISQQIDTGLAKGYTANAQIEVKSAAVIWAEREASRQNQVSGDKRAGSGQTEPARGEQKTQAVEAKKGRGLGSVVSSPENAGEPFQDKEKGNASRVSHEDTAANPAERHAKHVRCQKELDAIARSGTIAFPVGGDRLSRKSFALLDRIASAREVCGQSKIEISGHTDSVGAASSNQELSERRAEAVRGYLVRQGMPVELLSAYGYGETRPLAPNTTPENRALNRRIEFRVKAD